MTQHWKELLQGGTYLEEEYRLVTKSGCVKWVSAICLMSFIIDLRDARLPYQCSSASSARNSGRTSENRAPVGCSATRTVVGLQLNRAPGAGWRF